MGSTTMASSRNFSRHRVTANQYARGSPKTNKITVVHDANCTLSQSASKSMIILPEAEAVPAQNRSATFTEHKIAQRLGRSSILSPREDYPTLLPARIRIKRHFPIATLGRQGRCKRK